MIGLIGKKVGMTQIFDEKGEVIPEIGRASCSERV